MQVAVLDHGVCRMALVPVRAEPSDQSEQITQLLFGDHYQILSSSENKKWLRIKIYFDQYEGWIEIKQHHPCSKEYFDHINNTDFKIAIDLTSGILYKKHPLSILMGSIVPISGAELFALEEQFAFNGDSKPLGDRRDYDFLKRIALKYLYAPYQWGGKSPFGIDCSGFTQMVFKISGYGLLRDAHQQYQQGVKIESFGKSRPGDLIFFKNENEKITHVGIALEEDRIIHASGQVRIDHIQEEGILNGETKVFTHFTAGIRRILPA